MIDHAVLPGPYNRLAELEARLPLLEMYSQRPVSENPFFKMRLARIAPPHVEAPCENSGLQVPSARRCTARKAE